MPPSGDVRFASTAAARNNGSSRLIACGMRARKWTKWRHRHRLTARCRELYWPRARAKQSRERAERWKYRYRTDARAETSIGDELARRGRNGLASALAGHRADGGRGMRPRVPRDDCRLPRPKSRSRYLATPQPRLVEGLDAEVADRDRERARPRHARGAPRARGSRQAEAAVHAPLADGPFRGPEEGRPARRRDPRSRERRARDRAARGVRGVHRHRARALAGTELRAPRRETQGAAAGSRRTRLGSRAGRRPDVAARRRARGLRGREPAFPAMDDRSR